jgi:hypothetical protein
MINLCVLGFTFIAVVVYTGLTDEGTKLSRQAFGATQRAWLGIDAIDVARTHVGNLRPEDVQTETTVTVKNFGASLATSIEMNWNLARDKTELRKEAETICYGEPAPLTSVIRHITIFPSKTASYVFGGILPAERIKVRDKAPIPFLIGCFTYGDPYTDCTDTDRLNCHWTRFCYRGRYDPGTESALVYDLWNDYNDAE